MQLFYLDCNNYKCNDLSQEDQLACIYNHNKGQCDSFLLNLMFLLFELYNKYRHIYLLVQISTNTMSVNSPPPHQRQQPEQQQMENASIFGVSASNDHSSRQIKNATSDRNTNETTSVKERLWAGFQQITAALDFRNSYDDLVNAYANMPIQQQKTKRIDVVEVERSHDHKQTANNLQAHHQEQQSNHFNQTPFFGSQIELNKQKQSSISHVDVHLHSFSDAVLNIVSRIVDKNNEANEQLKHRFKIFSQIRDLASYWEQAQELINDKTNEAARQLMDNLQRAIQPTKIHDHATNNSLVMVMGTDKNRKPQTASDDNEFMTEQFSSRHRLQQVSKYVSQLEHHAAQDYVAAGANQSNIESLLKEVQLLSVKMNLRNGFDALKAKLVGEDNYSKNKDNKDGRVGSALVSQRMGSAQSKRLQSAVSKNSQNQQSFNLDLTVRTKNSKNPYHFAKGDSLMYSMDSGFGFQPESPTRIKKAGDENSNSSRSVLQKYNDVIDQTHQKQKEHNDQHSSSARKPIQKNLSQKLDHNYTDIKPRRLASSKQKIEEFHQQQNEDKSDAQGLSRQITEENIDVNAYHENNEISEQRENFFKPKYRDYDSDNEEEEEENEQKPDKNEHDQNNQKNNSHENEIKLSKHQHQQHQQDNQFDSHGQQHQQNNSKNQKKQKDNKQEMKKSSKQKLKKESARNQKEHKDRYQKNNDTQKKYDQIHNQSKSKVDLKSSGSPKPENLSKHKENVILSVSQTQKSKFKKIKIKPQENDDSSIKDGTIIDRVQNFDADDEDQDTKYLGQSADFSKKKSSSKPKKRIETEAANKKSIISQPKPNRSSKNIKVFNKVDFSNHVEQTSPQSNSQVVVSNRSSRANIFATEINGYQSKIARLREEKQMKKKNLQKELAKINYELKVIHQKEEQLSPQNKNGYASRVKISDNNEAQLKAEVLVKNLRSQKRNRNIARVGEFSNLDKNINVYMQELTKLRAENQQKLKQRKKIEILERMKQNQMRKISEKKKIEQNQQFVMHLKVSGESTAIKNDSSMPEMPSKRTPTKQQQEVHLPVINNPTPELSQKKAYLNRARGYSVKKDRPRDVYEQNLG